MKLHVSLRVADLERAITFYSTLFGEKPVIVREDYAKWDVDDPAVNFVVESGREGTGFDHFGIQVDNEQQLREVTGRMQESGHAYLDVEHTTCCYAVSDKAWVRGAADEPWEGFLTHRHDGAEYGTDRTHLLEDAEGSGKSCC